MAQKMRMNFFSDACAISRFFDNLLNPAGRKFRVTIALKNISCLTGAEMSFQFLSQFRQNRHIAAFAALTLYNKDHLLVKVEIFGFERNKFGNSGSGQKKRFQK